jgi:hypothetical protein
LRALLALPDIKPAFGRQGMDAASFHPGGACRRMRREDTHGLAIIRKNDFTAE